MWARMGAMMMQMMMHGGSANPNKANIQLTKKQKMLEDGPQSGGGQPAALKDAPPADQNVPPGPSKGPEDSTAEQAPAHEAQPQADAVLLSLPENQPSMKSQLRPLRGSLKSRQSPARSARAKLSPRQRQRQRQRLSPLPREVVQVMARLPARGTLVARG